MNIVPEQVILVNESDYALGAMEKYEAHKKGLLHRAFSVFVFNLNGQLLIQQRALNKYHSAGLWSNTCCSHPRPGEETSKAATRRLFEEMGLNTVLYYKTNFIYKAVFSNMLTEHEFDHIYTGTSNVEPAINRNEVNAYKWQNVNTIKEEIKVHPEKFTVWFKIAMEKVF